MEELGQDRRQTGNRCRMVGHNWPNCPGSLVDFGHGVENRDAVVARKEAIDVVGVVVECVIGAVDAPELSHVARNGEEQLFKVFLGNLLSDWVVESFVEEVRTHSLLIVGGRNEAGPQVLIGGFDEDAAVEKSTEGVGDTAGVASGG